MCWSLSAETVHRLSTCFLRTDGHTVHHAQKTGLGTGLNVSQRFCPWLVAVTNQLS